MSAILDPLGTGASSLDRSSARTHAIALAAFMSSHYCRVTLRAT